ncbi:hypothetical protein ACFYP4_13920 [Streptomyces sp. NPDC005551]|uniref:hypothetical protein n=1 Tax=Streptomyces sp. NPDC005551 TaxID=3364725 RepID=UPI0036A4BE7B
MLRDTRLARLLAARWMRTRDLPHHVGEAAEHLVAVVLARGEPPDFGRVWSGDFGGFPRTRERKETAPSPPPAHSTRSLARVNITN